MSTWVDFKALKEQLKFADILRHYKVEIKAKGNQHHGFCPLPNHEGNRKSPSFSANLQRGIFQCFGCGAKGNLVEFAALMENINPASRSEFHALAVRLQNRFCPGQSIDGSNRGESSVADKPPSAEPSAVVNAPLDFELKGLDQRHEYFRQRGLSEETVGFFGLGFCSRGLLKNRIAIPVHDNLARLVGYAGRVIDDAAVNEENPRYRFPGKREREGKVFEFRKTLVLYNGFRITNPIDDLIVVEGFVSVWWLHQHNLPNVIATMGVDCSKEQAGLIVELVKETGRVWIMPDGDAAGERLAESLLRQVSPHRLVRWAELEKDQQPTDLSADQLKSRFTL